MKRSTLLLLLLTLTASSLMAQRKVTFAVDAGVDYSSFLMNTPGKEKARTPLCLSPSLTGRIDLKLGNSGYYLSSGLSYYAPRSSQDLSIDQAAALKKAGLNIDLSRLGAIEERMTTHYLSIPLLFGNRAALSEDGKFSLACELGVRFSIGLGGSLSYTLYEGNRNKFGEASTPIFSSGTNGSSGSGRGNGSTLFLPVNIAVNAGLRAEYSRYYLRIGLDHGLTRVNRYPERSRVTILSLSTTLGVRF
ncbi:hypothetical protein [uncultured Porphyromonas sp.]|uniref:hypothetical protein n=1 Tax=uncultured Porphyromonas sp. TaxID=159274 RepID=UPI0026029278|nr:hypothetical protein [uncultured Porphyromonas sp.]